MKALGWGILVIGFALLLALFGGDEGPGLTHLGVVAVVVLLGLALALGSQVLVLARRMGYVIRTVRSALKGEPEPPPPPVDLMATMAKPMKAVPPPPDYHTPPEER